MAFTNSFTGKNTGIVLDDGGKLNQAQQGMSNLILQAEKLKQDTFRKNFEDFSKASDIDPVFVLSDSAMKTQAGLLSQFNNYWGKIYKERGGNLTQEDQVSMARDKRYLMMQQQQMQSSMQQALQDREMLSKDVNGNYDHEKGDAKYNNYLRTGFYNNSPLEPSAMTIEDVFGQRKIQTANAYEEPDKNNPDRIAQYSASKDDVGQQIANEAHAKPRVMKDVFNEWGRLPQEEKDKKLADSGGKNPILQNYIDNHWQNLVEKKFVNKTKTPVAKGLTFNLFGRDVKFAPGQQSQGTVVYGDKTYNKPIEFDGSFKLTNVPTSGAAKLRGTSSSPLSSRGNIEGYLKNYDPDRDVLILAATGTDPNVDNGTLMEIPAKNLNQAEINKMPIVVDGKQTTLGSIRGNKPQEKKKGELD
jgi:hypothetical protein